MPIILPNLVSANCIVIAVCGHLSTKDEKLAALMKDDQDLIAPFKKPDGGGYVRLIRGGHSNNHLHLDMAMKEFFDDEPKPSATGSIGSFNKTMENFIGSEVKVGLVGTFVINPKDLPPNGIIRSMIVETKTGNVGIKMSGARLSVTGAPVREISWSEKSNDKFSVTLRTQLFNIKISDNYLIDALQTLQNSLNVFVYGRTSNEPVPTARAD